MYRWVLHQRFWGFQVPHGTWNFGWVLTVAPGFLSGCYTKLSPETPWIFWGRSYTLAHRFRGRLRLHCTDCELVSRFRGHLSLHVEAVGSVKPFFFTNSLFVGMLDPNDETQISSRCGGLSGVFSFCLLVRPLGTKAMGWALDCPPFLGGRGHRRCSMLQVWVALLRCFAAQRPKRPSVLAQSEKRT